MIEGSPLQFDLFHSFKSGITVCSCAPGTTDGNWLLAKSGTKYVFSASDQCILYMVPERNKVNFRS